MPLNCTESLRPLDNSGGDDTSTKPTPATTNDEATAHKHVAVLVPHQATFALSGRHTVGVLEYLLATDDDDFLG
ncbi:hypothetical protein, partial [Streptomyces sp. NPDC004976]